MKNTGTYPLGKLRCGLAEKINAPARASAAFVAINLASKLAALVFTPIFTRLLSTESYGIYSLFISTLSVLLVLCSLELSGGVIMRVMQRKRELSHLVLSTAYVLCIIATVPVLAIWYAIGRSDAVSFPFAFPILALMLISQAIISLYLSHARFLYKWQSAAVAAVIQSIGAPILGIALIRLISPADTMHITLKLGAAAVALAILAACFAVSTVRGAVREAHKYGLCAKGLTREMLSIARLCLGLSLPMLPYYFAVMIISQSNRFFVSSYYGSTAVAEYSVAHTLGISLSSPISGVTSALIPWIMRKARAGNFTAIKRTLHTLMLAAALSIICFCSVSDILLALIAPPEYGSALPIVFMISLSTLPLALTQAMSGISIACERTGAVAVCGVSVAALSLILSYALVPRLGAVAAAAITSLSFSLLSALSVYNARRALGTYPVSPMYGAAILAASAAFAAAIYALRAYPAARYIILALALAALAVLIYKRRDIIAEKETSVSKSEY